MELKTELMFCFMFMCLTVFGSLAEVDLESEILKAESQLSGTTHRRSRRYVVFPEGSTFNAAFCLSLKSTTGESSIFTQSTNWVLSYELPNETIHDSEMRYEFPVVIRRHKRDLYMKVEKLMDSAGVSGRTCVLQAICEAGQQLAPRQGILEEILRLLLTNPSDSTKDPDWKMHKRYREAYRRGSKNENCSDLYSCPVSILQLALSFGEINHNSAYPG